MRESTLRHDGGNTAGKEERDRGSAVHTGAARGSAAPPSIGSGVAGTPRPHGSCSPPAGVSRGGTGGDGGAGRTSEARGPKGRVLSSSCGGAGLGGASTRGGDEVWVSSPIKK